MIFLQQLSQNRLTGAVIVALCICALALWVPTDIDTGIIEMVRRRYQIGDMLGPVTALLIMLVGGIWLATSDQEKPVQGVSKATIMLLIYGGIVALSLMLMRWAGPGAVALGELVGLVEPGTGYRPLRDTLPWKFVGFLLGGGLLVASLSSLADRQWSWRRLALGILIAFVLGAVFDLPFEDLILPPNGDV